MCVRPVLTTSVQPFISSLFACAASTYLKLACITWGHFTQTTCHTIWQPYNSCLGGNHTALVQEMWAYVWKLATFKTISWSNNRWINSRLTRFWLQNCISSGNMHWRSPSSFATLLIFQHRNKFTVTLSILTLVMVKSTFLFWPLLMSQHVSFCDGRDVSRLSSNSDRGNKVR